MCFQGSPNSGGEAVQGCWVQWEAPLRSSVELLLLGVQRPHPSGRAKQNLALEMRESHYERWLKSELKVHEPARNKSPLNLSRLWCPCMQAGLRC